MKPFRIKIYFIVIVLVMIFSKDYANTFVVSTSGTTFSPANITIYKDDTISFVLSSSHSAVEVSKNTYDANGSTWNNGFKVPFGGGKVKFPASGMFYYVCSAHFASGMKGIIKVLEHPCTSQVFDTVHVSVSDTSYILKFDTVHISVVDTIHIPVFDTVALNIDTIHVPVFDTIFVAIDTQKVVINDTILFHDTILISDTTFITRFDTLVTNIIDTLNLVIADGITYLPDRENLIIVLRDQSGSMFTLIKNGDFSLLGGIITDISGKTISYFNEQDFGIPISGIEKSGIYLVLLKLKQNNKYLEIAYKLLVQ